MNTLAAISVLLVVASVSWAAGPITWPKTNESSRVSVDDKGNLVVVGEDKKTTTTVLTLENPKVPSHQYRLVGKVKYQDVAGDGYVEMWNHFSKEGPFFSRTLAEEGPFGKITGSSDWRDLEIPFYSKPDMLPNKLVINVVLPGKGKVWITPLTLEKAEPMPEGMSSSQKAGDMGWWWWGSLSGFLSIVVGMLGGLLAMVARKPGTRRLTMQLTMLLIPTSLAALLVGFLQFTQGVQLNVMNGLGVVGVAWVLAFVITVIFIRRAISREELRRMQALDISAN